MDNDDPDDESIVEQGSKRSASRLQSTKKGKEKVVQSWEEDGVGEEDYEDDFPFPDDLDFGSLEQSYKPLSGPNASVHNSRIADTDPGRSFRPTTNLATTTALPHSSPYHIHSDHSHIAELLDEMDDPTRLRLITELSQTEQDFYRNHWRRGADKGSKKRTQSDDDEDEEEEEGGVFRGPQPSERKKFVKRGGGYKRGGFRGRARGRAKGRPRK